MTHLGRAALAVVLTLTPVAAMAGLEICNESSVKQTVAVGYKDGDDWVSEGWWNIAAGNCAEPLSGELTGRYYYYRALVSGREFQDENIAFCTVRKAFTIVGDEDCEARGYEKSLFAQIDTGTTARHFTFTITEAGFPTPAPTPAPTPEPTPAPQPDPSASEPGRYGEPYANSATLQECLIGAGESYCSIHADATKFFINDDVRTPAHVFNTLKSLEIGTPITVEGDLVEIYDMTAELVLRNVSTRSWSEADILLDKMQGQWYAVDDPNAQFTVLGAERENTYNGAFSGLDYLSIQEWCAGFEGDGPYLYAREEGTGESYCYAIENVGDWDMTLMFLPRGNFLEYRKLD